MMALRQAGRHGRTTSTTILGITTGTRTRLPIASLLNRTSASSSFASVGSSRSTARVDTRAFTSTSATDSSFHRLSFQHPSTTYSARPAHDRLEIHRFYARQSAMRLHSTQADSQGQGRFIRIVEVSPRDGLQNLPPPIIPTQTKHALITKLLDAGLRNIEVGSFVRGDRIPQMADTATLLPTLPRVSEIPPPRAPTSPGDALSGVPMTKGRVPRGMERAWFPVLVGNSRWLEGLLRLEEEANPARGGEKLTGEIAVFASATEAFSLANNNAPVDKVLAGLADVTAKAIAHGYRVRGYISCVMTDPYSGITAPADVVRVSKRLLDMGCYEISLGDTTGEGNPPQWVALWTALRESGVDMSKVAAHCHDTFAMSLPSLLALLPLGLRTIDSSLAGLGGCPYSPGATGNVPTEDVVYTLHKMGYETGVDLEKLVEAGVWLSRELGVKNESRVGRAIWARKAAREERGRREKEGAAEGAGVEGKAKL